MGRCDHGRLGSLCELFARAAATHSRAAGRRHRGERLAAYYALGATAWATISSAAAGTPGSRPGPRLVAAAVASVGGKIGELSMRETSAQSLEGGIALVGGETALGGGSGRRAGDRQRPAGHNVLKLQRNPARRWPWT